MTIILSTHPGDITIDVARSPLEVSGPGGVQIRLELLGEPVALHLTRLEAAALIRQVAEAMGEDRQR